ncbi:MAG: YggS family pyridoxal phosphate-dependent enzyme [Bacillota bacterium]|nr:YggS family pyridoxal phosphate-dependent enzyme [Bacillota bacterium]MDW7728552.1 YggS family pyridoxal phosphate-dependent enzyme [Bacillota bacterium]
MLVENYKRVQNEITAAARRAGRNPDAVKLIAVTKTVGFNEVQHAISLGIRDFGENRVQDAAEKVERFPAVNWHFIGHLQSNKVKNVLPAYSLIHSLDRLSLAEALQSRAENLDLVVDALVQVNVSGELSKFGLSPAKLPAFLLKLYSYDRIRVRGLMTMAPFLDDPEDVRPYFRHLRQLRDHNARPEVELTELSMGMTNDFIVAVEEGATMVRIGSALFG